MSSPTADLVLGLDLTRAAVWTRSTGEVTGKGQCLHVLPWSSHDPNGSANLGLGSFDLVTVVQDNSVISVCSQRQVASWSNSLGPREKQDAGIP